MILKGKESIKDNEFYKSLDHYIISKLPTVYTDTSYSKGKACSAFYIPFTSYYKKQQHLKCESPYIGELNAILLALEECKDYKGLFNFNVDNPELVKCLNKHGWYVNNTFYMRDWISSLYYPKTELAEDLWNYPRHVVTFVKSHSGIGPNEKVDSIAKSGLR